MKSQINRKQVFKGLLYNMTWLIILMFIIYFFELSGNLFMIAIIVWVFAQELYSVYYKRTIPPDANRLLIGLSITYSFTYCFIIFNAYLGAWGLLGFIISILILCSYILFRNRKEYMFYVRDIERQVWGATAEERREAKKNKCCDNPKFDENGVCWNCDPEALELVRRANEVEQHGKEERN